MDSLILLGAASAPQTPPLVNALWVLLLGSLLGLELIGKVPPTLHTPLMSGPRPLPVCWLRRPWLMAFWMMQSA